MDATIAKELAALREEIEALKAEGSGARPAKGRSAAEPDAPERHDVTEAWGDQVKDLIGAMHSALENAEGAVAVHPIAGVAAAFLAGLLIGRTTKSRA
jgi:ElaB/YqjD/DUF883 family membrane-anchored ribosome-binding protein